MPGIFFLVAYYFILVKMPIGQDMLMQSGEFWGPFSWTIISIMIWMLFAWYSSRLVSDKYEDTNHPPYLILFKHFPRLIGYNVAVGLQLAILNLPTIAALGTGMFLLLFIAHNLFYVLLYHAMVKQRVMLYVICSVIAITYLVYFGTVYKNANSHYPYEDFPNRHVWRCCIMFLFFFAFQVYFVNRIVWRRRKIIRNEFTPRKIARSRKGFNLLAAVAAVLYIVILECPRFANRFGALGVTLLAFALWVGFICLVKYFAIWLNVRLGFPLLLAAFFYGWIYNPYKVRLQETQVSQVYKRPGLDSFLNRWINSPVRKSAIDQADSEHPFNVYIVIADGGASKSGYWVASVLSKLEEASPDDRFSKHLLSLAGASGGSVGNVCFYSLLHKSRSSSVKYSSESESFFHGDFLTSSFARFLGPDLFRHIIPFIFMDDRAAVLEKSMEEISDSKLLGDYFKGPVNVIFEYQGDLPMLFINTTNLQSGSPGVVSNIKLDKRFTERMDILEFLDTSSGLKNENAIRLSTAVILGARFPYISPAGEIDGKFFVDGGYFDNSGGGITMEMLQHLDKRMNNPKDSAFAKLKHKLRFRLIYISNGNKEKVEDTKLNPLMNDLAAPLLTVVGTYGRQTSMSNQKLKNFMAGTRLDTADNQFVTLNLPMDSKDKIPYPMNWVISDFNLNRMKMNLDSVKPVKILK